MNATTETREAAERGEVMGRKVYTDLSGQGHCWKCIPLTADVGCEIEAEIIDGGQEECDDYTAANGQHYRW